MNLGQLGAWIPYYDDFGDIIYYYNDQTGEYMDASGTAPVDQVVQIAASAPPADPVAAGIDPNAIISIAGTLYKYVQRTNANGSLSYQAVPYSGTGGLQLSTPVMIGLAALAAFALLS